MNTNKITTANETLVKMTNNQKLVKATRIEALNVVISECISFAKENSTVFTDGKKGAVKAFINNTLKDKAVDAYTKRAIKVAKFIVVDGYKIKKELLSLAQIEQLICFNKAQVNGLMKLEGDEYIAEVKELINTAKIEKTTKIFSAKKAKSL